MKTQLRSKQLFFSKSIFILIVFFSGVNLWYFNNLYSKSGSGTNKKAKISFDNRLSFYLNQKSKNYLMEMTVNEKLLLQMIQNITEEIKQQGSLANVTKEINREEIYDNSDVLIHEYTKEINLLMDILEKITELERVADKVDDTDTWEKLADLHTTVLKSLDGSSVDRNYATSNLDSKSIVKEYQGEVDSVLALYKRLSILERKSQELGDDQLIKEIEIQKNSINELLGKLSWSKSDSLAVAYFNEAKALVNVLNKLENLQSKAIQLNSNLSFEIEAVRRSFVLNLDNKLLALMGYKSHLPDNKPLVSEIFKEWKANQYTKYKVHFTKYLIIKKSLLQNASATERARMVYMDLKNAFKNYNNENFVLSAKQFDMIFQDYGDNFEAVEPVLFYRAESYFIRSLYEEASKDYNRIVAEFSDSEHFGDSLYRLFLINEKSGSKLQLAKYCNLLESQSNVIGRDTYDKCSYLAGYLNYKYSNYAKAQEMLSKVSEESQYYLMAHYLLGIVYINDNKYADAKDIFLDLANLDIPSRSDSYKSYIRNNVLLKLGYLNYESGKYEEALTYFNSVSSEFSGHDNSLLGTAWANLKRKNYEITIENVNTLFNNYLTSNHIYEALVLSAHCKRLLNLEDAAATDISYVENARRALDLSDRNHSTRQLILNQLAALDRLEEEVLERRDERLFAITSSIRKNLQNMLVRNMDIGTEGKIALDNLDDELKYVSNQLVELHSFIAQDYDLTDKGTFDLTNYLPKQPVKTMQSHPLDSSDPNVNYFSDYPLAAKEGDAKYRKSIIDDLKDSIELERRKIQGHLKQIQNLQKNIGHQTSEFSAKMDLEILEKELEYLENESRQFQSWLAENQIENLETDYDKTADFTGYGMSNFTLNRITEIDAKISFLAQNNSTINSILEERKMAFEQKQKEFELEARKLEFEQRLEKIELEKKKSEQYFKESYFEAKEKEVTEEKVKVNQ